MEALSSYGKPRSTHFIDPLSRDEGLGQPRPRLDPRPQDHEQDPTGIEPTTPRSRVHALTTFKSIYTFCFEEKTYVTFPNMFHFSRPQPLIFENIRETCGHSHFLLTRQTLDKIHSTKLLMAIKGVARGKGGGGIPQQLFRFRETEKIVVEKWCYLKRLYF